MGVLGGHLAHRGELVFSRGHARLDGSDLAEPPLALGLLQAVEEVVVDLLKPGHLAGIEPELRAFDTRFSELAIARANRREGRS